MKRFNFFVGLIISSMVLFAVSCANPNSIENQNPAKLKRSQIVNVTFDPNGGAQIPRNVYDYALGSTPGTEMPVARRAGYRFLRWTTNANGTGKVFDKDYVLLDSITVYAQWQQYTTPFTINLNYSYAQEDGVTFSNEATMSKTATVAMGDTNLTITNYPAINEGYTRDLIGFYDADGVKVADENGAFLLNTPYTFSNTWNYDFDFENVTSLDLYPRWVVSIKANSVHVDQTTYNVELDQTFTITGTYSPANATTLMYLSDYWLNYTDTIGNIAFVTKSLECNNGIFSIEAKVVSLGDTTVYIRCSYDPDIYDTFTVNATLPSDPAFFTTIPTLASVSDGIPGYSYIDTSASTDPYDYTLYYLEDEKYLIYKVYLQANKTYYFEFADSDGSSSHPYNQSAFIDGYFSLYDASSNAILGFDLGGVGKNKYYRPTTSGEYYILMQRLSITGTNYGWLGCHVFLDCISAIDLVPDGTFNANKIDSSKVIHLKPTDNIRFNISCTPSSAPNVNLYANAYAPSHVLSMNSSNLGTGKYITLSGDGPGNGSITFGDFYSGETKTYQIQVALDGAIPVIGTASSTNINDYQVMYFDGYNDRKFVYEVQLQANHRYMLENAKQITAVGTELQNRYGSENFLNASPNSALYDATFSKIDVNNDDLFQGFPCTTTDTYYIILSLDDIGYNAVHLYDMGAINSSIALSSETLNLSVGGFTDISLTFNNGDPAVSSNFSCTFDDNVEDDDSGQTRFVSAEPFESTPGDISIIGKSNREFTFTGEPAKIRVMGLVPGKTKLIFTDENAQITKEVNITVAQSALDGALDLETGAASNTTSSLSDFNNAELSDAKLYAVYSVSLLEGVKYYFQTYDDDNEYNIANYVIDAHFYLEDSNNDILLFNDRNKTITYTCTATGTYYFVFTYRDINSAALNTGYAGVRWYAEPITSIGGFGEDIIITSGSTMTYSNLTYEPSNAYYDFTYYSDSGNGRIVNNINFSNGKQLNIKGITPGYTSFTIKDKYSSRTKTFTALVLPDISTVIQPLTINLNAPADPTDIASESGVVIADLTASYYEMYSINLSKGITYTFLLADSDDEKGFSSMDDCYFYLEDADYNIIYSEDSDSFTYTCSETGTYYFIITKRVVNSAFTYSTSGAVYAYASGIDVGNTISEITLPYLSSSSVTIPHTLTSPSFVVAPNDVSYISNYDNMLSYSISGDSLLLTSLNEGTLGIDGSDKIIFADIPFVITDTVSGATKEITVKIRPDNSILTNVSSISTTESSDIDDYYVADISPSTPVQVYSMNLQSGNYYCFQTVDIYNSNAVINSGTILDCFFILKNSNFETVDYNDDENLGYYCQESGTYYYIVTTYGECYNAGHGAFHVYTN